MSVPSYDPDLAEETGGWMSAEEMLRQADVTCERRGTKVAPPAKNSSSSRQHGKQKMSNSDYVVHIHWGERHVDFEWTICSLADPLGVSYSYEMAKYLVPSVCRHVLVSSGRTFRVVKVFEK